MAMRCVVHEGKRLPIHMSKDLPHVCFVAPHVFPVLSGDESSQVIGGAEVQQAIVARGLVKRGYRVSMICLDFGQEADVDIHGIRVVRAFRPDAGIPIVRFLWPRLTSLWNCMVRADADIYYQRTAGMLTGLVAAYCKHHGRKSIFAASGNPNFERNTPRIKYRRDRWLYEYGLMRMNRILAQNVEQMRLCAMNFGRESILVPNCYAAPSQPREAVGREILWVGTIRPLKRPQVFLDIAKALPQFQFKMVGGSELGDKGLFAVIKNRAERISNLKFMGHVPYARIDEHFDSAALLVNTSESEGFPNTFLQAWSRGIVSVASVECGAVQDGQTVGRVVSSPDHFVTTINELMADEAQRRSEGLWCREYFEKHHRLERILDRYETIFAELIAA